MSKTALFIDGSNLYATTVALGVDIDYGKLLTAFSDGLVQALYYTAIDRSRENPLIPLVDWLSFNGYSVVSKPTKEFFDAQGVRKVKGNMDIEITVDALELSGHIDHAVLFSGDGDFEPLVKALHRRGVRVTVVSTVLTRPSMVADELRRAADVFIDLATLTSITKDKVKKYG